MPLFEVCILIGGAIAAIYLKYHLQVCDKNRTSTSTGTSTRTSTSHTLIPPKYDVDRYNLPPEYNEINEINE
jgi:hypothetical protein